MRAAELRQGGDHELDQRHVGELDVRAQLSLLLRAANELASGGHEARARARGERRAVPPEQQLLEAAMAGVQLERGFDEADEAGPGIVVRERLLGERRDTGD